MTNGSAFVRSALAEEADMSRGSLFLVSLLVCLAAAPAAAETVVAPRFAVIPVSLSDSLSSATARVGDAFKAVCKSSGGGVFPRGTTFTGTITRVTRATSDTPGQIDAQFVGAALPDGSSVPLNGILVPMSPEFVGGAGTGGLVLKKEVRRLCSSFVAATGCATYVGVFARGVLVMGSAIGAEVDTRSIKPAAGREVEVARGTRFGIALASPVCSGAPPPAADPDSGPCGPADVSLGAAEPYLSGCFLMVPLEQTLDAVCVPLLYDQDNRMAVCLTALGKVIHQVGTGGLLLNGGLKQLGAPSRLIDGVIYVPAEAISITTGRRVEWNAVTKRLRLQ